MKKIISLFQRNYDGDHLVRDEVVPGAEWVIAGEGVATEKIDGTCCKIDEAGKLWRRYDCKKGKIAPEGFIAVSEADEVTGHQPGWIPVGEDSDDKWLREAFSRMPTLTDSEKGKTFELVGPKVNGNPYELKEHELILHGDSLLLALPVVPRTFAALKEWLEGHPYIEGIVWYRNHALQTQSEMVKIKRRDFGLRWPPKKS